MVAKNVPIPLVGGIDQSANTAVGTPRIMRLERCRVLAPGKLGISPGYYHAEPADDMRALAQVDTSTHIVSSADGWYYTTKRTRDANNVRSDSDEAVKWRVPAFTAPTRINAPGSSVAGRTVACWVAPLTSNAPHMWMLLVVQSTGSNEYPSLYVMSGTQIAQQINLTAASTTRYRLAVDYTTGTGFLVNVNAAAHTVTVANVYTGSTPLAGSTYTAPSSMTSAVDVASTTTGGHRWFCVLDAAGVVHSFREGTTTGAIQSFDVTGISGTVREIGMLGPRLLRADSTASVRVYDYTVGTAQSAAAFAGTAAGGAVAISKMPVPGYAGLMVSSEHNLLTDADVDTGDYFTATYAVPIEAGSPSAALAPVQIGVNANSTLLSGAPLPLSETCAFTACVSNSTVLRSYQLLLTQDLSIRASRALIACCGEMPRRAQLAQSRAAAFASASPISVRTYDALTGAAVPSLVIPTVYAARGQLTGDACVLSAAALVFSPDSTAMPAGGAPAALTEALCAVDSGHAGVTWTSCTPWTEGARAVAGGYLTDGPAPYVAQVDAATGTGVFTSGAVYQYIVQAEYRDTDGTLYRSPPSPPVSITIAAPTSPNTVTTRCDVSISWEPYAPDMPGAMLRLFRTVANGTVFYDTGLSTGMTHQLTTLTDNKTDAAIQANAVLTEGSAVSGGLKAKYGIPPCRFGWRGKDRMIVGGGEQPNRVRWSQLLYPGEAVCFPHATELGWTSDFPDTITAVAALDDAWIVFSRTKIWAVYGAGPDDNGAGGSFEPPRLISANCGCVSWRSVAEIAEGLLFQAPDGQIWLVQRGQLSLQWFSAAVRDELESGLIGTTLTNPIVAVIPHQAGQTIHFVRAPSGGVNLSPPLVFDRRTSSWSTDGAANVDGLNGALGGAAILDYFEANPPDPQAACDTVAFLTPDTLTIENATGAPMAPIGLTWTAVIETNDIAPFDLAGWGEVRKVAVVAQTSANTEFLGQLWLNRHVTGVDASFTLSFTDLARPLLVHEPALSKCSAVRLHLEWDDRATYPAAIALEVEPSTNQERTAAGARS